MFIGRFQYAMDAKGRMMMPSEFRLLLGERFVVSRSLHESCKCLYVYPMEGWNAFTDKLKTIPMTDLDGQDVIRELFSEASLCKVDSHGRLLLPEHLRAYAELDKDVIVMGSLDHAEIWAKEGYESYKAQRTDRKETLKKLEAMGI